MRHGSDRECETFGSDSLLFCEPATLLEVRDLKMEKIKERCANLNHIKTMKDTALREIIVCLTARNE